MKIEKLACPSCGSPLSGDFLPNKKFTCSSCGSALMVTDLVTDQTIVCPQCQTPNHEERRFCSNCGGSLKEECVLCYTENRIDIVYCVHCGAHMERAKVKRERMLEKRRHLQAERTQILMEKEARQKREKLERLLSELDEPANHEFAIYQLNQLGDDAIEPLIETLLNDNDPDARYGSAIALGRLCAEHEIKALNKAKVVKSLIKALTDAEPAVRYWTAEALGKVKNQTAIKPLTALLKDSHKGVRQQAQQSLEKLGKDV